MMACLVLLSNLVLHHWKVKDLTKTVVYTLIYIYSMMTCLVLLSDLVLYDWEIVKGGWMTKKL